MFAGNCTSNIQFYIYDLPIEYTYQRAVTWSIAIARASCFETVFAIGAINEPQQDYSITPGDGLMNICTIPHTSWEDPGGSM